MGIEAAEQGGCLWQLGRVGPVDGERFEHHPQVCRSSVYGQHAQRLHEDRLSVGARARCGREGQALQRLAFQAS